VAPCWGKFIKKGKERPQLGKKRSVLQNYTKIGENASKIPIIREDENVMRAGAATKGPHFKDLK